MDRRFRQHTWILLATFVVGGVLGPVVHRIQHLAWYPNSNTGTFTSALPSDHDTESICFHQSERSDRANNAGFCTLCSAIFNYVTTDSIVPLSLESVALLDTAFPAFPESLFLLANSGRSPPAVG